MAESMTIDKVGGMRENVDSSQTQVYGATVLELLVSDSPQDAIEARQTPPQPFLTHTRSGSGMAQIQDDQDHEYLYE